MASFSSPIKNLEEKFLQCPVCLEQLRDPRSLPCLHRYCSNCLETLIIQRQRTISCPECRTEYNIPSDGVNGFKKDFHIQNIIEFVNLEVSLKNRQDRQCCGCSKTLTAAAFSFKCSGYLCTDCFIFHTKNHMVKDHMPHLLSLKDLEVGNIPVENLLRRKDMPRCKNHAENITQLCCKSCSNLVICVACTYGEHKIHDIEDASTLAKTERERLSKCIAQVDERILMEGRKKDKVESLKEDIVAATVKHKTRIKRREEESTRGIERRILALDQHRDLELKRIVE